MVLLVGEGFVAEMVGGFGAAGGSACTIVPKIWRSLPVVFPMLNVPALLLPEFHPYIRKVTMVPAAMFCSAVIVERFNITDPDVPTMLNCDPMSVKVVSFKL